MTACVDVVAFVLACILMTEITPFTVPEQNIDAVQINLLGRKMPCVTVVHHKKDDMHAICFYPDAEPPAIPFALVWDHGPRIQWGKK